MSRINRIKKRIEKQKNYRRLFSKIVNDYKFAELKDLKLYGFIQSNTKNYYKYQLSDNTYLVYREIDSDLYMNDFYLGITTEDDILTFATEISYKTLMNFVEKKENEEKITHDFYAGTEYYRLKIENLDKPTTEIDILKDIDKKIKKLEKKIEKIESKSN